MILLIGSLAEPMLDMVLTELDRRKADVFHFANTDLPGTVGFSLTPTGEGYFLDAEGKLELRQIGAIYHRMGFGNFEAYEDYSDEETAFVNEECTAALNAMLNNLPVVVVNPPDVSSSNASKPFQISLIERYGFSIPDTLVTNDARAARAFFERWRGELIYKSISYHRSIVQPMTAADLSRLDTLRACPVQLQQSVPGYDLRVHVVGDEELFATRILAEEKDYRYDKEARLSPWQLPDPIAENCLALAEGLGMHLAGIDLRVTPEDEYYCFEVNPSPAFAWYEQRTGQPISAALCDFLQKADRASGRG